MNKQLQTFIDDFSNGGAIRHLADRNLSVAEITKQLSFPMSSAKVAEIVWKHYLDIGKIRLTPPTGENVIEKVSYVQDYDKFGIPSLRKVMTYEETEQLEYVECHFGKEIYQDKEAFQRKLEILTIREREYILGLPWPLEKVYHRKDDMIMGIMEKLGRQQDAQ